MADKTKSVGRSSELVTVFFNKDKNNKDDVHVAVNGKVWVIPRGKHFQVPRFVKEVLDNQVRQDNASIEYQEMKQAEFKQGPK